MVTGQQASGVRVMEQGSVALGFGSPHSFFILRPPPPPSQSPAGPRRPDSEVLDRPGCQDGLEEPVGLPVKAPQAALLAPAPPPHRLSASQAPLRRALLPGGPNPSLCREEPPGREVLQKAHIQFSSVESFSCVRLFATP